MEKGQMTNRQKVVEILMEIEKNSKYKFDFGLNVQVCYGKIGDDFSFYGEVCSDEAYPPYISLMNQDKGLARIHLDQGYYYHLRDESGFGEGKIKSVNNQVKIDVISAASDKGFAVVADDTAEKLRVIYAQHENPDKVIDGIRAAIAQSKDKAVIAQKLSKLNLPGNVQSKHEQDNERVKNTNANSGREM